MLHVKSRFGTGAIVAAASAAVTLAAAGVAMANTSGPTITTATTIRLVAHGGDSGIEHFQFMTTSTTTNMVTVIVHGVFTAGGIDMATSPTTDTIQFPNGTIMLKHSPGTGTTSLNPRTCLFTANLDGTQTLLGGTGKYAGISGHQTAELHILAITARSHGKCTQSVPPVSFEELVSASGPVNL
jgi:hypothetical protein